MTDKSLLVLKNNEESELLSKAKRPVLRQTISSLSAENKSSEQEFFKGIIRVLNSSSHPLNKKMSITVYSQEIKKLFTGKKIKKSTNFDSNVPIAQDDIDDIVPKMIETLESDGRKLLLSLLILETGLKKMKVFLNEYNVVKFMVISLMEVGKYYDDLFNGNQKLIAKILEISTDELMSLEMEFLSCIDYKLTVSPKELNNFHRKLVTSWINNKFKEN